MPRAAKHRPPPRFLTKMHHFANEEKVYEALVSYVVEHGKPPSTRAIAATLGMDHVTVHRHIDDLVLKGRVRKTVHGRLTTRMEFPEIARP
jgi:DNA-binding MarR family transcriptional regulator